MDINIEDQILIYLAIILIFAIIKICYAYLKELKPFGSKCIAVTAGSLRFQIFGDSTSFKADPITTISGIASILKKTLKLTSWYC